jgi:hypothetical protein
MTPSLSRLESRRSELVLALSHLNDMRPGSIVGAVWRCGKPNCHCAQAKDPGHGPEPKKVAGAWRFDSSARPADGKLSVWASLYTAYLKGSQEVRLDGDRNPGVTIRINGAL